ncbi:phage major tail tube protein [Pararhizobium haloflavum]|uniref:phage major tail tube protein n=1 Tax=Pararhizobium haloflavum TaxID=2037914 RepID=UPI000C1813B7|nr:phage major tail tube protein [Pararhizobium haloflavum]
MAQQPLLILTAVDVRRATEAGTSRATTISTLTIPPINFVTTEHSPGGGVMAVNFTQPRIEALEPTFSCKGLDPEVFRGMGVVDRWVFAAVYKDAKTNRDIAARGIIEGAVTSWEPDESDPTELQGSAYSFAEVTHLEFNLGGRELIYFDFWERAARRDGEDLFASVRRALGA